MEPKGSDFMWINELADIDGDCVSFSYNEESICPICKRAIKPERLTLYGYRDNEAHKCVSMMYLCHGCCNTFVAKYRIINGGIARLQYCGPSKFAKQEFNERISAISPQFVKIYNQSKAAEEHGLDEICGIGYRKALEFLVKDYLCHQYPDDTEEIKSMMLGKAISTKIVDPAIQTLASRCAWLGNDQTHYVQKFGEYDLKMLKELLEAVVHSISIKLITDEAANIDKR